MTTILPSAIQAATHTHSTMTSHGLNHEFPNGSSAPSRREGIAVVGMGCRLPGGVRSDEDLWRLLIEGRSGYGFVPSSRYNVKGFYHPEANRPGSLPMQGGYFLEGDVRKFDNAFFGISNLEALYMDPAQRQLLEIVYETVERAGVSLEDFQGSNTGCFIGNYSTDYLFIQGRNHQNHHRFSGTGATTAILANRVSHAFNLTGPSLTIDTACSSSLTCLHLACKALENGECDAAIVAGANLILSVEQQLGTARAGILSPSGKCRPFDADADGYGRAEGVGALYLKRVTIARADGNHIRSIIRGTAINDNGRTPGISIPSVNGQKAVIRKAYADAGLDFSETGYVECHGTGTAVGDPIEVEALSNVFSAPQTPLLMGSVKSNLGHSEAVSGITSIIKTTLAIEHATVPPSIAIHKLNPKLCVAERNFLVVQELTPWPRRSDGRSLRASINSFGFGGSNAHAIIEAGDCNELLHEGLKTSEDREEQSHYLIPLSANTRTSLCATIDAFCRIDAMDEEMSSIADQAVATKSCFAVRSFCLASSRSIVRPIPQPLVSSPSERPKTLVFLFTGQGAHWPCMGRDLLQCYSAFRDMIAHLDLHLQSLDNAPEWRLEDVIAQDAYTASIEEAQYAQPATTAIQIGIIHLFRTFGSNPNVVIGHSSGEIAAAYAAGLISDEFAITISYLRGLSVSHASKEGAMAVVGLSVSAVECAKEAVSRPEDLKIACINSSQNVTVSGNSIAVDDLVQHLTSRGVFARKLKTGGRAYHSHHMESVGSLYQDLVDTSMKKKTNPSKGEQKDIESGAKMISTVCGEIVKAQTCCSSSYWRQNLELPVQFQSALEQLDSSKEHTFVEIGPHSVLELPLRQNRAYLGIPDTEWPYFPSMLRNKNSVSTLLRVIGNLWTIGYSIDLKKVNGRYPQRPDGPKTLRHRKVPAYQWQHDDVLWQEGRESLEFRNRAHGHDSLLGEPIPGSSPLTRSWKNLLNLKNVPWLAHHRIDNEIVFPAAGYIVMAVRAVCQLCDLGSTPLPLSIEVSNIHLLKALKIPEQGYIEVITDLKPVSVSSTKRHEDSWTFDILSISDGGYCSHAVGIVKPRSHPPVSQAHINLPNLNQTSYTSIKLYDQFADVGLKYEGTFRSLNDIYYNEEDGTRNVVSKYLSIEDPSENEQSDTTALDALLQAAIVAGSGVPFQNIRGQIPTFIENVQVSLEKQQHRKDLVYSSTRSVGLGVSLSHLVLLDTQQQPLISIQNTRMLTFKNQAPQREELKRLFTRIEWRPDFDLISNRKPRLLDSHLQQFCDCHSECGASRSQTALAGIVDLLAHKNPTLKILVISYRDSKTTTIFGDILGWGSLHARCADFFEAFVDDVEDSNGDMTDQTKSSALGSIVAKQKTDFDVVVLCQRSRSQRKQTNHASSISQLERSTGFAPEAKVLYQLEEYTQILGDRGTLLTDFTITNEHFQQSKCFALTQLAALGDDTLWSGSKSSRLQNGYMNGIKDQVCHEKANTCMLVINKENTLNRTLVTHFETQWGRPIDILDPTDILGITRSRYDTLISTLEIHECILSTCDAETWESIKTALYMANTVLWISKGRVLANADPDQGVTFGFFRTLAIEEPSLKTICLDISDLEVDPEQTARHVATLLAHSNEAHLDREYLQRGELLYCSRLYPDLRANQDFCRRKSKLIEEQDPNAITPVRLAISEPSNLSTLHFEHHEPVAHLVEDAVRISVRCVGLNAKDYYVLNGRLDTPSATSALEFAGVVTAVGAGVSDLQPGDRVIAMAPSYFSNVEIVPAWSCCRMMDHEAFEEMSTVPLAHATALYALCDRVNLRAGESVLIHSASGGVGLAALRVAQSIGAKVFATVGSTEKKEYLMNTFGLKHDCIFDSHGTDFLDQIMSATRNQGVDVVLNSLTGPLLHKSVEACAPFGRFIEIGKRDIIDGGMLDMKHFSRNITFSAFDLSELYASSAKSHHQKWNDLLKSALEFYRTRIPLLKTPLQIFSATEVEAAFRKFADPLRIGKIAVTLGDCAGALKIATPKFQARLDKGKSYLMVGCLGGLGRSISKYLLSRGASHFTFLSRSGTAKPEARELVGELQRAGANVQVVVGDIVKPEDVQKAVAEAARPLGGIIQATMNLNEALYVNMSHKQWHDTLASKVRGTWNLHNAIEDIDKTQQLDFFLMISSISGTFPSAAQCNYCAANAFLDQFALYRRKRGLPASAIGFGLIHEIGYMHENPKIDDMMRKRGFVPLGEEDVLITVDMALAEQIRWSRCESTTTEDVCQGSFIVGCGVDTVKAVAQKGFDNTAVSDPRLSILWQATTRLSEAVVDRHDGEEDADSPSETMRLAQERAGKEPSNAKEILTTAALNILVVKLSEMTFIPSDQLQSSTRFSQMGLDSMFAAEFRAFLFKTLGLTVSFLSLMEDTTSIGMLVEQSVEAMMQPLKEACPGP